jgi:hypothetical protein
MVYKSVRKRNLMGQEIKMLPKLELSLPTHENRTVTLGLQYEDKRYS